MNKGITLKELTHMCIEELKKGNGDKYVLISSDDEGNSFHTLFFGFSTSSEDIEYALEVEHDNHEPNEVIILG